MTDRNESALVALARQIQALAFRMPPPNEWTPQFVMLAQAVRREALAAPAAPAEGGQGAVWIVTREGPEWSEIQGVYATEANAERKADKLELRRKGSKDVIDSLSGYIVRRHELIDSAGGAKGDHPEDHCERCGGRNVKAWHAPNELWNSVTDQHRILCPQCFTELAEAKGVVPVWQLAPAPQPAEGEGAVLPVLDAAKGFADVNDDGDYVFTPAGLCEFEKVRTRPAATAVVPEGLVLVPREPTEAMRRRGADRWIEANESAMTRKDEEESARCAWSAMLAAAPAAPKGGVSACTGDAIRCHDGNGCECAMRAALNPEPQS